MKKIVLSTVLVMALASSNLVAWGMPSIAGVGADSSKSSGAALTAEEVDAVLSNIKKATALFDKSISKLSLALLDKDAKAKIDAEMEKAQKITDPKERDAAIAEVRTNQLAAIKKVTESAEGKEKVSKLSKQQAKSFIAATYNFSLAGLMDANAITLAKDVTQKVSANPMAATSFISKVNDLKDAVKTLPVQVEQIVSVGSKIVDLAKSNKIDIKLPSSATEAPNTSDDA